MMKKTVLYAALALTAASSWAFYPKPDESSGCMMIISNPASRGFSSGITVTTVAPDGTQSEQNTKIKSSLATSRAADAIAVRKVELAVLNSYIRNGWHVLSVTSTSLDKDASSRYQTVYLLEKR